MSRNINDNCWVRLTANGQKLWAAYWNRYSDNGGVVPKPIRDSHCEKDGRTRFQIWELANIFGQNLYNGSLDHPFDRNEIWFEGDAK